MEAQSTGVIAFLGGEACWGYHNQCDDRKKRILATTDFEDYTAAFLLVT
jgi:hypothetical protein